MSISHNILPVVKTAFGGSVDRNLSWTKVSTGPYESALHATPYIFDIVKGCTDTGYGGQLDISYAITTGYFQRPALQEKH